MVRMSGQEAMPSMAAVTEKAAGAVGASFDEGRVLWEALLGWERMTFDTGCRETVVAVVGA